MALAPILDSHYALGALAAVLLGAAIGLERQLRSHPAGLHTNALVALGSAAYVIAGALSGDPAGAGRVAGQVVTGVGFICAGLIWHEGSIVRGLNTAATVWCSCAVGVLAGIGQLLWAVMVTVLVLITNIVLHGVAARIGADTSGRSAG